MRLEMIRQFNSNQGDPKIEALRKLMAAGGVQAQTALGIQNDAGGYTYCSLTYTLTSIQA